MAIIGSRTFYETFVDVLSLIGYWSAIYTVIILSEHIFFRSSSFSPSSYSPSDWNSPRKLPLGIAAILTFAGAFALVVPCMDQVFYVGPISKYGATGDIGSVVGAGTAALLYPLLRWVEKRATKRRENSDIDREYAFHERTLS